MLEFEDSAIWQSGNAAMRNITFGEIVCDVAGQEGIKPWEVSEMGLLVALGLFYNPKKLFF